MRKLAILTFLTLDGVMQGPSGPEEERDAVAALERRHGKRAAAWRYHNASGEPVGVIVRWDRPNGKDIRPVSRKGSRWIVGGMTAPRPLYRLPEM